MHHTSFSRRRESRVDGRGTNPPSHSHHVIPKRSEESPPFAPRKGARGMPTRHSRAGGNPEGTGWENHGNHYPIMAIMVQHPRHSGGSRNPEGQRGVPLSLPLSEGELKSVQRSDVRREFPYPLKSSQAKKHDVT